MLNQPIFFERNRVGRVYTGGKLFGDFLGDEPVDGYLPEEWVASAVVANNTVMRSPREGVSKILGSDMYFDELLEKHKEECLGKAGAFRILVKYLDSAIRLPAQAHPDKAFSRAHFNSEYGKTESWLVLATRPGARIYFGFKEGVTEEIFKKAIEDSENDKDAMERLMEYTEPKIGDVYLVPAKTVHAIGAGCLILEVQEPTDFTIQPERWCGEYKLSDKEMYIGLSKDDAVSCFTFGKAPDTRLTPELVSEKDGVRLEKLIYEKHTDCFVINRIILTGGSHTLCVPDSYGVYIITEGSGVITGDGYKKEIKKGDYFFMPASLMGKFTISGNITVAECY